ncbi:MAG: tRNA epoxyqueuosine(34) reductase QueG [Pyrinomonadaceae bacterium]
MAPLAEKIKQKAVEIGFDKVGIVRADPLTHEREYLDKWLNKNFHGQMAWMEREPEKRADPQLLFPEAKSIIVVAVNYFTDHKHAVDERHGKISRYAWGDDYHDVLREKLSELLEWIRSEHPQVTGKICVDTAPFMDKAWAVRAGLGWLGKHTNLITKELGSWVFIGSLLVDLELDHDTEIVEDHCGTCTACLDACPTNAIVEPYVVDSRKCISYATIELRDESLPDDIAANLDGWLYGCDICQDVCPWNRFEKQTSETRFEPRGGETSLDLDATASMEHDEYVTRFRGSAVKRAKLTGLKRNARHLTESKQSGGG